jgi:hypothetical protein
MEEISFLEINSQLLKDLPAIIETDGPLPYSQNLTVGAFSEAIDSGQ